MKYRVSIAVLFVAATIGAVSASAQMASRLQLKVRAPVELAGLPLAPGTYDVVSISDQGLFEVLDRSTLHASYVLATCRGEESKAASGPRIVITRDNRDVPAITSLYFPASGSTYRFDIPASRKEGVQSAQNGSKPLR
jgi:hypothetical protein